MIQRLKLAPQRSLIASEKRAKADKKQMHHYLASNCTLRRDNCGDSGNAYGMVRCTAPVRGHRSAAAAANCPACGGGYRRGYGSYGYSRPSFARSTYGLSSSSGGARSSGGGSSRSVKPSWSAAGSTQLYTSAEVKALTPIRETWSDTEKVVRSLS